MNEEVNLTLGDIGMCVMIIDTVSQRGAIKGEEMADVGALRNRLKAFLDSQQAPQEGETSDEVDTSSDNDSPG